MYEIQSSSSVSATASRFSIFLIRLRPRDRIRRFSMPDKLLIFSIVFVLSARCLRGNVDECISDAGTAACMQAA